MARLVEGGQALILLGDDVALLLHAHDHLEQGFLDLLLRDQLLVAARCQQRGLIEQVLKVCAGEAGGRLGDIRELDVRIKLLVARMHLEDRLAALDIRRADIDLTVKAARTQQRIVQNILAVGRGDDDDALVRAEAVHLDQQLIERLLALVVPAAEACAALTADRVDLVDKHNSRRVLLCLLEQVAHTGCAHADIQLDEVRAGDRQEGHARLARDCTRDQGFTGARRADQQHALGDARADLHELLRVLEELDDLLQLRFFLVRAGHVVERDLALVVLREPCARLAELHRTRAAAGLLVHHKIPERDEQHDQDHIRQEVRPPRNRSGDIIHLRQCPIFHLLVDGHAELAPPNINVAANVVADDAAAVAQVHGQRAAFQRELVDLTLIKVVEHIRVGDLLGLLRLADHIADARQQEHQYDQVKAKAFHFSFQIGLPPLPC